MFDRSDGDVPSPKSRRLFWAIVVPWCIAGVALGFFYTGLNEPFVPIGALLLCAWILCSAAGVSSWLWSRWHSGRLGAEIHSAGATFLFLASLAVAWPGLVRAGDEIRFRWHFERIQSRYEAIVARVSQQPPPKEERHAEGGIEYIVDPGPPVRIAFVQPGGILDNWQGIIFDPSGEVMRIGGVGRGPAIQNDPKRQQIWMLFGGGMFRCEHIKGRFYRCWFT
jgi:hypothetical protein